MNEVWKDIKHYEGLYQINNYGKIRSMPRVRRNWTGGVWIQEEQEMKPHLNSCGYYAISLFGKDGKRNSESIHRLVALTFIENPENKPEVNHINGIRTDNRVENLEWVTRQENNKDKYQRNTATKNNLLCITTGEIFTTSKAAADKNGGDPGNIRKSARINTDDCIRRKVNGYAYLYIANPDYINNIIKNNLLETANQEAG